ncbi:pentapeptide repeat-containing protein [Bifidobacterium apri]|uniref:pentapeptide repeat-containing protein n=1 Tax=Bifidobacterium apri TaxID=1769423 RepID=UPI003990EA94
MVDVSNRSRVPAGRRDGGRFAPETGGGAGSVADISGSGEYGVGGRFRRESDNLNKYQDDYWEADYRELPDPEHPLDLKRRNMSGQNLQGSEFAAARIAGTSFRHADLTGSRMTADINHADFTGANLTATYWGTQALFDTNMRCAYVQSTSFRDINGEGAGFQGSHLSDCDFTDARLPDAYFEAADLTDCTMRNADLTGAQMGGATMTRVNLTGADLSGADMTTITADQVAIDDANLKGTRFTGIEGFTIDGRQVTVKQLQERGARLD